MARSMRVTTAMMVKPSSSVPTFVPVMGLHRTLVKMFFCFEMPGAVVWGEVARLISLQNAARFK